jgi:hypothetical protein
MNSKPGKKAENLLTSWAIIIVSTGIRFLTHYIVSIFSEAGDSDTERQEIPTLEPNHLKLFHGCTQCFCKISFNIASSHLCPVLPNVEVLQ